MNCLEFEAAIQGLLDARADPAGDAVLITHADACPACRALLRAYCHMAQFSAWHAPADSARCDRLVATTGAASLGEKGLAHGAKHPAAQPGGEHAWNRRLMWNVAAIAASLLLCAAIAWQTLQPPPPAANLADRARFPQPPAPGKSEMPAWPGVDDMRHWLADWAADPWSFQYPAWPRIEFPSFDPLAPWADLPQHIESIEPYYQVTTELPGVRTFHTNVSFTVEVIRNALPPRQKPQDSIHPPLGFHPFPTTVS